MNYFYRIINLLEFCRIVTSLMFPVAQSLLDQKVFLILGVFRTSPVQPGRIIFSGRTKRSNSAGDT
jgi:hypothetical protein